MTAAVLRRVVVMPFVLLGASFLIFSALYLTPGSPEATLFAGRTPTRAEYRAIRLRYHLNDPFLVQYARWLGDAATGNFGDSISQQDTVAAVIKPRIGPTLELAGLAGVIILTVGVAFGVLAALRPSGFGDRAISIGMLLASAVSPSVMSLLLVVLFAVAVPIFPALGLGGGGLDRLYHLALPAIALATASVALVGRTTRVSMIAALSDESVETARSRGLPPRLVIGKHALRHALIPPLTIAGLITGYLISGAVVVEYAFGLNGLGSLLVSAVESKDFALVQGIGLVMVFAFLVVNLLVDLLYLVVDPRIRLRSQRST